MVSIPYIKIELQEQMTQLYLNGEAIHEDKIETTNVLKNGHLIFIEIYKKERLVWRGYKVKDRTFKEIYEDTMKRKYYV